MAIFDTNLDYTKLIQFTNGTIQLGSFVQIRNALVDRFKEIYGNDIDVSPATADGQYINSIALLFNNIFQTIQQSYNSLDPAVATGQYLDTLCSFNNIHRIRESASVAQLYIYNPTNQNIVIGEGILTFIDKNNVLWIWDNGEPKTFEKGSYELIDNVICQEVGPIAAYGANTFYDKDGNKTDKANENDWGNNARYTDDSSNGTIYQCVNNNGLWVWQYSDAEVGNEEESDEALRSRRYQLLGNSSVTLLEGLKGSLLNIDGIKDVYIFNNMTSNDNDIALISPTFQPVADNTPLKGHSIYLAIRIKEGVKIDPKIIGKVIYNKLTPGISTSPVIPGTTLDGDDSHLDIVRTDQFVDHIHWKNCSSKGPEIVIKYLVNSKLYNYPLNNPDDTDPSHYDATGVHIYKHTAESPIEEAIVEHLQDYIDDIKINDFLTISNLLNILQQADIQKQGMNTFFASNGYINGNTSTFSYPANLAYFKYDDSDYEFEYDTTNNIATLTIKARSLEKIVLEKEVLNLTTYDPDYDLKYSLVPSNCDDSSINIVSSDTNVVTIVNNKIHVEGSGTATVTYSIGSVEATCQVNVEGV